MPELPSGTVTFLFTDIEGSTRLLKQLRGRYGQLLDDHHRLLRASFEEWGGQEIDSQGDAFFVAFRRAKDAISAAVAAQRALAAHVWPDGLAVRVRMGLHTGEPSLSEAGLVRGLIYLTHQDVYPSVRLRPTNLGNTGGANALRPTRRPVCQDRGFALPTRP